MSKSVRNTLLQLNSQGSVVITIFLTLMVVVGVAFVYFYYTQLTSLGPPPLPIANSTPAPDETADWKPYEDPTIGLSLRIPNDWYVSEDNKIISQFPYDSKRNSSTNIYNNFSIDRTQYQLQSGYTNDDWLNRIDNLKANEKLTNEYRPATSLQIVKISSGRTAEGLRFVVFKNTVIDEGIIAIFQKNEIDYIFVLQHSNQLGIETLQKIISTAQVTSPAPTP